MRFPRNAQIFRGQLDPAPVAGVFFLLILFVLMGFMLYTPGALVLTEGKGSEPLTITSSNTVILSGRVYTNRADDLEELRLDMRKIPVGTSIYLKSSPGASARLRDAIVNMMRIEPPISEGGLGTDNPVALVAVNPRGQFFFENELCDEATLRGKLSARLQNTPDKKLTLVLLADKSVSQETIIRLGELARQTGIGEVILSTRPSEFSTSKHVE